MRDKAIACFLLQLALELSSGTDIQTTFGSTVVLPCLSTEMFSTDAEITWTFNDQIINGSLQLPGSVVVEKDGQFLSISPVTFASGGDYVCVAKSDQVEVTQKHTLTVESLHNVIKVPKDIKVYLPCKFLPSGVGAQWYKKNSSGGKKNIAPVAESRSENEPEWLYPNDPDHTVLIRKAAVEDTGLYICESPSGRILNSLELIVEASTEPSCEELEETVEPCLDENSRTAEPTLQAAMAEFSIKLYSYLKVENPSGNLLFSPVSIGTMLSHLLLGASGNTLRELEDAMCVSGDFTCVHQQMKKQREKMAHSLEMASQIYYSSEKNLSESFAPLSIQYYGAEPTKLLKNSEENTQMINSWVANKTKHKITRIVDEVPSSTQLIFLNAVSFSGQWKTKFSPKPKKGQFKTFSGSIKMVPILYHEKYKASVAYIPELKAQVGRFALTGNSSLYILLPHADSLAGLREVEDRLTDTNMLKMIEDLSKASTQIYDVALPQIKMNAEPNMNMLFRKIGLARLFEGASMCGLFPHDKLVLDSALHKAFLSLTEQGVEAGAVTSTSFSRTLPTFSALRPFLVLLWSDRAKVPLFIGRLIEP